MTTCEFPACFRPARGQALVSGRTYCAKHGGADPTLDELRAAGVRVSVAEKCYGIEESQKQPVRYARHGSESIRAQVARGDRAGVVSEHQSSLAGNAAVRKWKRGRKWIKEER